MAMGLFYPRRSGSAGNPMLNPELFRVKNTGDLHLRK